MKDRRRLRFALALGLFGVWVLGLGALAWRSGEPPQPRTRLPVPAPVAR
jgi:hypothetical protein